MEEERKALGSQLTERLESRLVRRPRIGFSPGFYERFGFTDPWLPQAYTESQHGGDEYTFLSGAPFREFMESLGRHRWEREQRYERQFSKALGASSYGVTSRQMQMSGSRGLFGSLSMVLPPPVITAAMVSSEAGHWDEESPRLADARPYSHAKKSESPWLSGPTKSPRVPRVKPAANKVESERLPDVSSAASAVEPDKKTKVRAKLTKTGVPAVAKVDTGKVEQATEALAIDVVRKNARTTLLARKSSVAEKRSQEAVVGGSEGQSSGKVVVAPQRTGGVASRVPIGATSSESQEPVFAPSSRSVPSHTQRAVQRAGQVSFESSPLVNTLRDISPALPARVQSALVAVLSDTSINSERSDEMVRSIIRKGGVPRAIRALLEERLSPSDSLPMEAAVSRAAPDSTKRLRPVLSKSPIVGELLNPAAAFIDQTVADDERETLAAPFRQRALRSPVDLNSPKSVLTDSQMETSPSLGATSSQPAPQSSWVAARSAYGTAPMGRAVRTLAPKIVSPVREEARVRSPKPRKNRLSAGGGTLLTPSVSAAFRDLGELAQDHQAYDDSRSAVRGETRGKPSRSPLTKVAQNRLEDTPLDESGAPVRRPGGLAQPERSSRLSLDSPTQTPIDNSPSATVPAVERVEQVGSTNAAGRNETIDKPSATVRAAERGEQIGSTNTAGRNEAVDKPSRVPLTKVAESRLEGSPLDDSRSSARRPGGLTQPDRSSRLSLGSPTRTPIDNSPSATVWAAERGDLPASSPVFRATSALRSHIPFAVSRALKNAPSDQRFVSVQVGKDDLEKSSLVQDREVSTERRSWDRSAPVSSKPIAATTRAAAPSGRAVRWPASTSQRSNESLQYSLVEPPASYASTITPKGESWYEAPNRRVSQQSKAGEVTRVQRSTGAESNRYLGATKFLGGVSGGSSVGFRGGELGGETTPVSGSREWRGQRVSPTSIVARGIQAQDHQASLIEDDLPLQAGGQYSRIGPGPAEERPLKLGQRPNRTNRAQLNTSAPSLLQTLGDVSRGDQSQSAPPWAERALGGPAVRGTGDLIQSLARASSSEDVVRIIMDRGDTLSSSAELPSTTLEVVRQIRSEAKSELPRQRKLERRSMAPKDAPSMSGISGPGAGRGYRPARRVSGWNGKKGQSVHGSSGVGDNRIMKLAKRLQGLVLLAENNRRDEARNQVRLAANEAPKASAPASGQGGGATPGQLDALIQEVVQAVGRELEMRRERTQEESDGWW